MINTGALRRIVIDKAIVGQLVSDLSLANAEEELRVNLSKHSLAIENFVDTKEIWADIPSNWTWTNLDNLTNSDSLNDGDWVLKKDMSDDGEVKLIQLGSIGNCFFKDKNHKLLTKDHFYELNGKQLFPGYMLINRLVTDRMNACIIPKMNGILMTAVDVCWVKPVDDLYNIEYLMYALSSSGVQNMVSQLGHGVTRFRISKTNLVKIPIPFPPLDLQNKIVNRIKEILSVLDNIDDMQQQYDADIEILKNKIIDAGIQGKLTEQLHDDGNADDLFNQIQSEKVRLVKEKVIKKEKALPEIADDEIPFELPKNWKWVRLGDLCSKISSGNTPAGGAKGGAYIDEGYCFFREQNIYNDGIHEEGMVYISEELLNSRPNSTVLPDDILLNITGGSIGRCALVPDDFTRGSINQHILIIRTVDPQIRFYVHKCICSPYYQKLIMGNVVGDKDGFSAGRCKNTLIPLPPLKEQERIVERIDGLLSAIG